jgi:hypothetical protein
MKKALLGAAWALLLLACQPASANPPQDTICTAPIPPYKSTSHSLCNQDALPTPPGSIPAIPAPGALWIVGGGFLALGFTARYLNIP